MTPHIVVDTDVLSFLFRQDSRGELYVRHLEGCLPVVSFMTVAELHLWKARRQWGDERVRLLDRFLERFAVYDSDANLCERWAAITEQCYRAGRPINCADAWIAATALELGCPLATHNARDYETVRGLEVVTAAS